jgi:hypothetical protein
MKRIFRSASPTLLLMTLCVWAGLAIRSNTAKAEGARVLPPPAVDLPPGEVATAELHFRDAVRLGVRGRRFAVRARTTRATTSQRYRLGHCAGRCAVRV